MPRLFKEVDLPNTCYVQEVVYWLAFGRVPEFIFQDDDYGDQRMGAHARQTGEMIEFDAAGFTEAEFRSVGVAIDFRRYDAARLFAQGEDVEQYIADWDARFARYQPDPDQDIAKFEGWKREHLDRIIRDAEEGRWALAMDEVFNQPVDMARMTVMQALVAGDLEAYGWVANPSATDQDEAWGAFERIPQGAWSLRFGWAESRLTYAGKTYEAVQVHSEKMLELFPKPSCAGETVSMRSYPGVAVVQDSVVAVPEKPASKQESKRGRPAKQVGSLGEAVRNWYLLSYKNKTPPKAEAVVAEAQAWISAIFNKSESRSAVQYWLKGVAMLPENPPENDARNSPKYAAE